MHKFLDAAVGPLAFLGALCLVSMVGYAAWRTHEWWQRRQLFIPHPPRPECERDGPKFLRTDTDAALERTRNY